MKDKTKVFFNGYCAGIMMYAATLGLYQDYIGLERWLARSQAHWITMPWWPWLLLIVGMITWITRYLGEKS